MMEGGVGSMLTTEAAAEAQGMVKTSLVVTGGNGKTLF